MNAKLWQNLDFNQLQALNLVIHNLTWAPASPVKWQKYFNTVSNLEFTYNGTIWISSLDRANHIWTQLASTISDFDAQVRLSRLDQMLAPTASVSFNSQLLTNLLNPVNPQDSATKSYVDWLVNGTDWKASVRVIAIANITLSWTQTIDSVSVIAWDRVLVAWQSTWSTNWIYVVASWAWTRSTDADTSVEVTPDMCAFVEEWTTYADTQWRLTTNWPIVLWTTALTFTQIWGAVSYTNWTWLTLTWNVFAVDFSVVPKKYSVLIWDWTTTIFTITHNLWTTDIQIVVKEVSTWEMILVPYKSVTTNTASVEFAVAPASNAYRVIVIW